MNKTPSENKKKLGSVLIVGGGIGSMQAALDLANSGFKIHMVQKDSSLGGTMAMLDKTFPTGDCAMCMLSPKLVEVGRHLNIDLYTLTEVVSVQGAPGNFTVRLKRHPRYVDAEKCTGCGLCEEKCPKKVVSEYDQGAGCPESHLRPVSPGVSQHAPHRQRSLHLFSKREMPGVRKALPVGGH